MKEYSRVSALQGAPAPDAEIFVDFFPLEERILFDGAAAAEAADYVNDISGEQAIADEAAAQQADEQAAEALALAMAEISGEQGNEIYFVDAGIGNSDALISAIPQGAEVVLIDAGSDGVDQIKSVLKGRSSIDAIHILSHGDPGEINLGNARLDAGSISYSHADALASIGDALSEGADILVYGCDFGQDQSVLAALARATGADVAASDDETGSAELGGDWQLEVVHGSIEATPLSATGFDGLLDAPEVTVPATNLSTAEDTDLTISDISVADADDDPLTVSLSVTNGTITLAQTTGLTGLTGDGTNVVQFTGSAADINAAISGMTYSAPADFNGFDSLTIVVSDGGDTVNASVDIEISGVNDNPTLTPAVSPDNPVASEGGEVVLTAAHFGLTDPDLDTDLNTIPQLAKQILFRLDASNLPENGTLFLDGTSPLLAGSGFSLQDVQDGRLSYKHNGSDVSTGDTDDFAVTFNDGGGSGVLGPTDIIIDLLPVNQTPTIGGSPSVFEGEGTENTFAVIPAMTTQSADIGASLSISDRDDTAANSTITITNINNAGVGTLFWDVDGDGILTPSVDTVLTGGETFPADELAAGRLRFAHDGTEPGGPNPSFDIEVTDAGGGTGTPASSGPETIEIAVTPNNDNPELIINNGLTVDAGDTATISSGNLEATDPDNTDQNIFYVVTRVPTLGELRIDGEILGVGGRFTQADIDSGRLDYRSTSTVNDGDIDTFDFEVRDPTLRVFNDSGIVGADREPDGSITEHTFEITLQGDLPPENGQEPGDPAPGRSGTVEILSSTSTSVEVTERDGTLDAVPDVADSDTATITTSDLQFVLQIADGNGSTFTIAPEETFYQITSPPDNGTLFLSGVALGNAGSFTQADIDAGNLIFVHDGSENHQGKFEFNVTAGTAETFSGFEFDFNAIPTNDPPTVVTTDLPLLPEGATTRVTTQHIALGDVDTNDEVGEDGGVNDPNSEAVDDELWFQVTDLPDNGTLERFDGTDWVAVTTDDLLHSSLLTASVQSAPSGLRYVHDGSENHADSFNVRVRDDLPELADTADPFELRLENGTGGVGSANPENISASSTVNVTLGPQNDAPISPVGPDAPDSTIIDANQVSQTTANERLFTAEGATEIITSTQLRTVDPDTTDPQTLQYRITSSVAHGNLRLNGNILGINSTFTQDDIDNNRLVYTHDGSENFADQFQFIVSDSIADHVFSDAEGAASGISTFEIVMNPVRNDPPTITNTGADTIDLFGAFTHNFGNALTLADPDLVDVDTVAGEEDFLQITVTLRDSGGNAVDLSSSGGITLGSMNGLTLTDADDNDGNLTFQGTFSDVQAALTNLEVEIPNQDFNDTLTLDVTVDDRLRNPDGSLIVGTNGGDVANGGELNDGGTPVNATNNTDTVSITFRASDDNDAPTATAVPGNKTVNEDAVLDLSGYVIDDVDAFGSELTVTLNVASGHLSVDGNANTSDPSTLTLTGTLDEINTHLAGLTYIANTNFHSSDGGNSNPDDDQLTITVSDGGASGSGGVNTVSLTPTDIAINPVNDPPTVTVPGTQTLDDGSASITFSNANGNEPTVGDALDADNTPFNDLQRLTVSVPAGTGTLSGGGGLADLNTTDDHILIFEGTLAQLNAELDGLTFTPVNNNADTVVPITVEINDLANGGAGLPNGIGGALTATDTFNVQISGQNDPPLVTSPPAQSVDEDAILTFSSGNGNAFTVSDTDDFGAVMEATVSVNFGTVTATSGSGATLSNDGTGTLTITGTEDQINAALDGLVYTPNDDFHTLGVVDDTISVTIDDLGNTGSGGALSDTQTATITVNPINDRPEATVGTVTVAAVGEDRQNGSGTSLTGLLSGNYDDTLDNQTANSGGDTETTLAFVAIVGSTDYTADQGTWQVSDGSGGWIDVPVGGLSASNALVVPADRDIRFVPEPNFHGTPGTLQVRLADGDTLPSSSTITASNGAGDLKDLSSEGGTDPTGRWSADAVTIDTSVSNENDPPTASNDVTLTAIDEDTTSPPGDTVSNLFSPVYDDETDNQTGITGGADASTAFGGIAIVGSAADPGTEGTWQYSTDNGTSWTDIPQGANDDTSAILLPTDAQLRFVPVENFNGTPGALSVRLADTPQTFSSSSDISAVVGDDDSRDTDIWSDPVDLDTLINPVNDPPGLVGTDNASTVNESTVPGEGTAPVQLITGANVTDIDLTTTSGLDTDTFGDGIITVSMDAGQSFDQLTLTNNTLPGIDSVSGGSNGADLEINLLPTATLTQVNTIIEALQYNSSSDTFDGVRDITITLSDGNNVDNDSDNAGGPAPLTATVSATVTINEQNDPPVLESPSLPNQSSTDGQAIMPINISANFSDVDASAPLTFSATNLPPGLSIDPDTGVISGTLTADASQSGAGGSYTVLITTDDGRDNGERTDSFIWTVTNPAPMADDDVDSTDEETAISRDATAGVIAPNDRDGGADSDVLTVDQVAGQAGNVGTAVTGSNGGQFTINTDGSYTFDPNGDFNDLPVGQTSTTSVTYRISDGQGGTDSATLTITVTGVNDTLLAVDDSFVVDQDGSVEIAVLGNDSDPDNDPLTMTEIDGRPAVAGVPIVLRDGSGTVVLNAGGTVRFTAAPGYSGPVVFDYVISDGSDTARATVRGTVTSPSNLTPDQPNGGADQFVEQPDFVRPKLVVDHIVDETVGVLGNLFGTPSLLSNLNTELGVKLPLLIAVNGTQSLNGLLILPLEGLENFAGIAASEPVTVAVRGVGFEPLDDLLDVFGRGFANLPVNAKAIGFGLISVPIVTAHADTIYLQGGVVNDTLILLTSAEDFAGNALPVSDMTLHEGAASATVVLPGGEIMTRAADAGSETVTALVELGNGSAVKLALALSGEGMLQPGDVQIVEAAEQLFSAQIERLVHGDNVEMAKLMQALRGETI